VATTGELEHGLRKGHLGLLADGDDVPLSAGQSGL
jgi:hypothetical protein